MDVDIRSNVIFDLKNSAKLFHNLVVFFSKNKQIFFSCHIVSNLNKNIIPNSWAEEKKKIDRRWTLFCARFEKRMVLRSREIRMTQTADIKPFWASDGATLYNDLSTQGWQLWTSCTIPKHCPFISENHSALGIKNSTYSVEEVALINTEKTKNSYLSQHLKS